MKSALLGCALFLLPMCLFAQHNLLELLPGSERLEYDDATGKARLIGNVSFLYQGNKMYCDSAHYYQKKNLVYAYGHVHINKRDTLNLFCDSLRYNGRTRKAKLWGNVRVRDNEYKLTTDSLDYDARKSQASYTNGGTVRSILTNEVLTSRVGYFHPESKNFFFSHDVVYKSNEIQMTTDTLRYRYSEKKTYFYGPTKIHTKDTDIYCESGWYNTQTEEGVLRQNASIKRETDYISGDTLIYQPLEGTSIGKGNVYYIDSTQQMSFKGDYALISDSLHYSFLTGNALAIKELNDDTLYIHADTLYSYKLDSTEYMRAHNNAGIYSTKFQCKADSIAFTPAKEKIELFRNPIVWSNGAELKGDFIDMHLSDSIIHQVTIHDHATLLMTLASDSLFNQIAGSTIIARFNDNDLYQANVNGNAMTIFFPEDEVVNDSTVTTKRMGMNRLYSSDLRIDIDSNEVTGITYLEEPDGVFYPMDQLNEEEQFVPGFEWLDELRPKNYQDLLGISSFNNQLEADWDLLDKKASWFQQGIDSSRNIEAISNDFLQFYSSFVGDSIFQSKHLALNNGIAVLSQCDTTILYNNSNWEFTDWNFTEFFNTDNNISNSEGWDNTYFESENRFYYQFRLKEVGWIYKVGFEKIDGVWQLTLYFVEAC